MTSGLVPIQPTGKAAGGTVGTTGIVTFTDADSVSLDGVFTTACDSYRIEIDATAAAQITAVLRHAGVDDSSASYETALALDSSSATQWVIAPNATDTHRVIIEISAPALPRLAVGWADFLDSNTNTAPSSLAAGRIALQHRAATAYDGFTITPSIGTMTGTVRVLGYSN